MTETGQGDSVEVHERGLVSATEMSWALREVNRMAQQVDTELARRLRLRQLDHAALGHILTAEIPLGPAELSARLGISSGSGTELVDRLERAGHLQRHRDTHDRRRVFLRASETAVQSVLSELAPLFAALDAMDEGFTPEEQAAIIRYLRTAAGHMRHFLEGGRDAEDRS